MYTHCYCCFVVAAALLDVAAALVAAVAAAIADVCFCVNLLAGIFTAL